MILFYPDTLINFVEAAQAMKNWIDIEPNPPRLRYKVAWLNGSAANELLFKLQLPHMALENDNMREH